ncbi:MarR family winged helix-turn-helix transcriptional regulator [Pseudoroseomonas ludipueritiae]|uniref:MarR family transcriptional regulator n=1 Tax=Pseudoroseomonas ludipueritiae TaxID=198093 RepID=A0ABR7R9W8_9PROT|nr:MarR family transcriptional regulator [Pseudoroseomonas ludipueritiae]MBC9178215.1 MarR family transcriptional regulator [Pseudoroseomonas ludipueritiae]MCG7361720.1 MarR family transcriptional regulator [Roseomonas sp. ACRSG]
MTEKPANLDDLLCFAVHSAAHAIQRANKPLMEKLGLTYPQYLVMVVLWSEDNQTVGSIGDRLFLESSTLTPLLKRLQAAGLVQRVRDATDERQVRIQLTDQGRALAEKAKQTPEWLRHTFCEKSDEARALRESITRLRDSLVQKQD